MIKRAFRNLPGIDTLLIVGTILYFSYAPFVLFSKLSGLSKTAIFIALIILTVTMLAIKWHARGRPVDRELLIYVGSYSLFALWATLGYAKAGNRLEVPFPLMGILFVNPIVIVMAYYCRDKKLDIVKSVFLFSSVYFIFGVVGLGTSALTLNAQQFQSIFPFLEVGYYQNVNLYLGLFGLTTLVLFWETGQRMRNVVTALMLAVILIVMFTVGGRSSMIGLFLAIAIFSWQRLKHQFTHSQVKTLFGVFATVAVLLAAWPLISPIIDESRGYRRLIAILDVGEGDARVTLYVQAIALIFSDLQTFIFGAGLNGFPEYTHSYNRGLYPHNIFLELMAEYGLVGLILFTLPILVVLAARKRALGTFYGDTVGERSAFLIAVVMSTIALFSGTLQTGWLPVFFWYLLMPGVAPQRAQ